MRKKASRNKQRWYKSAIREAARSECKQLHGAVIVKGGRILSSGHNKRRNDPKFLPLADIQKHVSVHAEIDALRKAGDVAGADIYVVRVDRDGHDRFSKPCLRCWEKLRMAGIRNIFYT